MLSKSPYSMVVTTQVNCKATSKNIEKSQQVFQDQPIKIETVQRIYLSYHRDWLEVRDIVARLARIVTDKSNG